MGGMRRIQKQIGLVSFCLAGFFVASYRGFLVRPSPLNISKVSVTQPAGRNLEPESASETMQIVLHLSPQLVEPNSNQTSTEEIVFKMGLKPPYAGQLSIDHVPFMGWTTVASVSFHGEESPFKGTFQATQVLVNYTPSVLFHGRYEFTDGKILLSDCEAGDFYQLDGSIGLTVPYPVALTIRLKTCRASDVFFISELARSGALTGTAKGEWRLAGSFSALELSGMFELMDGQLGKNNPILFSSSFFSVEGMLPILTITEGRVNGDQGVLLVKGEIDLRQFGKGNPMEKIKFYSDTKTMRWKGWDIQAADDDNREGEVKLGKNISQDMRVSFKGFMNDELEMQRAGEDKNEFVLEYRFQKNKRIKMQVKGHEEFLGMENRVKF